MPLRLHLVCTTDIQLPHFMILAIEIIRKPDLARPPSPPLTQPKRPHISPVTAHGKARVFDLLSLPKSKETSTFLEELGFEVNNIFTTTQEGQSCGYIAAFLTAHLALAEENWYHHLPIGDFTLPILSSDQIGACNAHLGVQSVEAVRLTGTQCETLITYFYKLLNNGVDLTDFQKLRFVHSCPFNTFNTKVIDLKSKLEDYDDKFYSRYKMYESKFPLYTSIVNTHNRGNVGEHWYLVAFDMCLD